MSGLDRDSFRIFLQENVAHNYTSSQILDKQRDLNRMSRLLSEHQLCRVKVAQYWLCFHCGLWDKNIVDSFFFLGKRELNFDLYNLASCRCMLVKSVAFVKINMLTGQRLKRKLKTQPSLFLCHFFAISPPFHFPLLFFTLSFLQSVFSPLCFLLLPSQSVKPPLLEERQLYDQLFSLLHQLFFQYILSLFILHSPCCH